MSTDLKLHELTGSPNNVKVRIALGYKGLEYERLPAALDSYPGDRSQVAALSRQPRLPVLQHGDTVVFDSGAILRYLEANFPDTPPLFTEDYAQFGQIEGWELFARTRISEPIGMLFGQAFSPEKDSAIIAKANQLFDEVAGGLEDELAQGDYLLGDKMTAADIVCASPMYLADQTEEGAGANPIAGFFHANLKLGAQRETTRNWIRRVLAHDPVMGRQ